MDVMLSSGPKGGGIGVICAWEGGSSGSSWPWGGRDVLAWIDPGPLESMSMIYPGDLFSILSLDSN